MTQMTLRKALLTLGILFGVAMILGGCSDEVYVVRPDHTPPSRPKGLYSVTADQAVYLYWDENDEPDFKDYRVYRSVKTDGAYYRIAVTKKAEFVDEDVQNGATYYYTVTARDENGNESDLSNEVHDTSRPEGFNRTLYDRFYNPKSSGFDFSQAEVVDWEDSGADIYLEFDSGLGVFLICAAGNQVDIQDFGYTDKLDDVDWAPSEGWSKVGWVEVIKGHSYIVWTASDHYAKLRVGDISANDHITFDWAYQIAPGNQELVPRPPHEENYLRTDFAQAKNSQK
ncbi:MAG: hypothetical protein WCE90_01140 [Candidatus Zixiibacteriota bacterium]